MKWCILYRLGISVMFVIASQTGVAKGEVGSMIIVPLRGHVLTQFTLEKAGVSMDSWLSVSAIQQTVLPEVNRIWQGANIQFKWLSVDPVKALNPANRASIASYLVTSQRNQAGKADSRRIKKLNELLDFQQRTGDAIDVYFVPYLGERSQGHAKRKARLVYVAQWTDKYQKNSAKPHRFSLTESRPFQQGSLSRTLAHELGHILGLAHPDKTTQLKLNRLMGGKQPGYTLTRTEVETARAAAMGLLTD